MELTITILQKMIELHMVIISVVYLESQAEWSEKQRLFP